VFGTILLQTADNDDGSRSQPSRPVPRSV